MDTILRIKEFLGKEKITKNKFYTKTGISNGYLDKVKSIGSDKIEIIINTFPELNLYWLISGEGQMIVSNESPMEGSDSFYLKKEIRLLQDNLKDKERIISLYEKKS